MSLFEPEETVGRYWHRLVGGARTYRHNPDAAVQLETVRRRIEVMFRALGGSGAIRIVSGTPVESAHRLSLMRRVGLGRERIDPASIGESTLQLPSAIDVFPGRADNEALYEWLAAWSANAVPPDGASDDPLRNDILRLRSALATTRATLQRWPGLDPLWRRLCRASLEARPRRRLPRWEAAMEAAIDLLQGGTPAERPDLRLLDAIRDRRRDTAEFVAPNGYATYLPVPVWAEVLVEAAGGAPAEDADEEGGDSVHVDRLRRRASRRANDQSRRGDPLILHRFETIFSLAEMVNVNRSVEDDDEEGARQAADDLPELTLGSHRRNASTRLKLDLELAHSEAATDAGATGTAYPEWDYRRQAYRPRFCRVAAGPAPATGEDWSPDAEMQRRIRQVRRQFEVLRPKRRIVHGEPDGHDLDLSALVRDFADRRAGGAGTERIFVNSRTADRDLSIAVLMDVSLSTDAWLGDRRVLDVEKSALLALTHGLTACGDEHGIFTFTSRRTRVHVSTVKDFGEDLDADVIRRIQALKPGQYTRIGAAVRHLLSRVSGRPHRHRLLLVLTDGKPNDVDHYEGRYGIEDTRMAICEARKAGVRVFGVTVDEHAREYFPYIFGRGAYAIFPNVDRLPTALPMIYRHITS